MEIGSFQLENLALTQSRFCLIDLRAEKIEPTSATLRGILRQAVALSSESQILDYVRTQKLAPESPLVLLCEDGHRSKMIAGKLEDQGFLNVYSLEGGVTSI